MDAPRPLPRRAKEDAFGRRPDGSVARLEFEVARLQAEREGLRADLELARGWVRDLLHWGGLAQVSPALETKARARTGRRVATVLALVGAPWVLLGGVITAAVALL